MGLILAALHLVGCKPEPDPASLHQPPLPTASVRVRILQNETRPVLEEHVGTVKAKARTTLEAKISGRIDRLPVSLGQHVKTGDLMARIDAAEINARLEQAEAALEQTEREWKRVSSLFDQNAATRVEYDAVQSRNRAAKAAAAEAKAMLSYVVVTAPFDGVISHKWVELGDLATPGKPLLTLEDVSSLQLEADVPQSLLSHLRPEGPVAVRVDGIASDLAGTIREVAPIADPTSRTVRIKVDLPRQADLVPGQFARLRLLVGEHKTLRIPASALLERGQLEMVFLAVQQHARIQLVTVGERTGDSVEILSGLHPGDAVVVEGAAGLTDGQPVNAQ